MFYDVLINYVKPDEKINTWFSYEKIPTYSMVVFKFKKEINSIYNFVYVRKRFEDKQCFPVISCFRLITKCSYTFNHFPKISDYHNSYLSKRFIEVLSYDKK